MSLPLFFRPWVLPIELAPVRVAAVPWLAESVDFWMPKRTEGGSLAAVRRSRVHRLSRI